MNQTSKKWPIVVAVVVVVLVAGWYLWSSRVAVTTYAKETVMDGNYAVAARERTVLQDSATLTIKGNFVVDGGELTCEDGPLLITVEGDLKISNGSLRCIGDGAGIAIVAMGAIMIDEDSEIIADGPIQIVSQTELLATTEADFEKLYQDAATPSGGNRIGPLIGGASAGASVSERRAPLLATDRAVGYKGSRFGIAVAEAQDVTAVIDIAGRIVIPTPPKKPKRPLVVFNFPGVDGVRIQNLDLQGPDGRNGETDTNKSCNAKGADGSDAMRFLAYAGSMTVNNFTLTLGSGGAGGAAETKPDCYPQATATGGKGGSSGNFKMVAEDKFQIIGAFDIVPGRGGDGGQATANAKSGDAGQKGGDATATGGAGADNIKTLGMSGTVAGVSNVAVGSMTGGAGGNATANGGAGGDGEGCGKTGGAGGKATATGGKGGNARVNLIGGALRTAGAEDRGGNGGNSASIAGKGGNGGSCDPTGPGGNGGKGGDAKSTAGKGGASTENGTDGTKTSEAGGNGGNGGDGCKAGKGGKGGNGDPKGADGTDGKDNCIVEENRGANVVPGGGTQTDATVEIEVIQYGGKYIPTSQLMIEEHSGCDDDAHWHSKPYSGGPVKATDGSTVNDPGPQCGFGKTSQVPVMKIKVPAAQIKVNLEL